MRLLNRVYAWIFGYFWLPCPVCGDHFGGHEASRHALVVTEADGPHAYCTCYKTDCQVKAAAMNVANGYGHPFPL